LLTLASYQAHLKISGEYIKPFTIQNREMIRKGLSGVSLFHMYNPNGMKHKVTARIEIMRFSTGNRPVFKG